MSYYAYQELLVGRKDRACQCFLDGIHSELVTWYFFCTILLWTTRRGVHTYISILVYITMFCCRLDQLSSVLLRTLSSYHRLVHNCIYISNVFIRISGVKWTFFVWWLRFITFFFLSKDHLSMTLDDWSPVRACVFYEWDVRLFCRVFWFLGNELTVVVSSLLQWMFL